MTFLNGIVDGSYSALHDILMEDDSKTYTDCILALRKKAVDTEESKKGCCPLRRVAAKLRPESPEEDTQVQHNNMYLLKKLWESFNPEKKKICKANLCQSRTVTFLPN